MQESFFREDSVGNGETGRDEPTDVQVILSRDRVLCWSVAFYNFSSLYFKCGMVEFDRISWTARVKIAVHILAQIEKVGADVLR